MAERRTLSWWLPAHSRRLAPMQTCRRGHGEHGRLQTRRIQLPRGWFVVADSAAVEKRPYSTRCFGEDVVLFRAQSGAVAMLEAYCPHMGTHLGRSQASHVVTSGRHIDGDDIRCPFHGWRFGLDGASQL